MFSNLPFALLPNEPETFAKFPKCRDDLEAEAIGLLLGQRATRPSDGETALRQKTTLPDDGADSD